MNQEEPFTWPSSFLNVGRRRLEHGYRRFETTYRSHLQGSSSPTNNSCCV